MAYDYIAGYEKQISDYQADWVPGKLKLFSNAEHGKPIVRRARSSWTRCSSSLVKVSARSSRRSPPPRSTSSAPSTPAKSSSPYPDQVKFAVVMLAAPTC